MPTTRSIGLAFEKLSVAVLRRNSFDIEHCGRTGDKGIDFKGHWVLLDKMIPVIGMASINDCKQIKNYVYIFITGQCKCHCTRSPPIHVRELEGTLTRMRSRVDFIGMLITATG